MDRPGGRQHRISSRRVDRADLHVAEQRRRAARHVGDIDQALGPRCQRCGRDRLDVDGLADIVGVGADRAIACFKHRIGPADIHRRHRGRIDDALAAFDANFRTGQCITSQHLVELHRDGGVDEHVAPGGHRQGPGRIDIQRRRLRHIDGRDQRGDPPRDRHRLAQGSTGFSRDRIACGKRQRRGCHGADLEGRIARGAVGGRAGQGQQLADLIAIGDPTAATEPGDLAGRGGRVGDEIHRNRLGRRDRLEGRVKHDRRERYGLGGLGDEGVASDGQGRAIDRCDRIEHRAGRRVLRCLAARGPDGERLTDGEGIPIAAIGAGYRIDRPGSAAGMAEIHPRGHGRAAEILHIGALGRGEGDLLVLGEVEMQRIRHIDRNRAAGLADRPLGDQRDRCGRDIGVAEGDDRARHIFHQPRTEQRHQLIRRP